MMVSNMPPRQRLDTSTPVLPSGRLGTVAALAGAAGGSGAAMAPVTPAPATARPASPTVFMNSRRVRSLSLVFRLYSSSCGTWFPALNEHAAPGGNGIRFHCRRGWRAGPRPGIHARTCRSRYTWRRPRRDATGAPQYPPGPPQPAGPPARGLSRVRPVPARPVMRRSAVSGAPAGRR